MSSKALVVEGGAMRGIFAAGVLDAFLEQEHNPFDFVMASLRVRRICWVISPALTGVAIR